MRSALTALFLAATAIAQQPPAVPPPAALPPAPQSHLVRLTSAGFHDEPSIAIDPHNSQQLAAAYQVNATVAYSEDGGQHWKVAKGTAPTDYKISGDVSITYDPHGAAVLCYIAFDRLGTDQYWAHGATRNGIFVRRSPDGGKSWEPQAHTVLAHNSDPGIPFEDKPYIVADNTSSPNSGNLYIGWTQFTLTKSVILFSRSIDSGVSWSAPIEISTHEGLPRDDNGSVEGFSGAVGSDGTLYVAWVDGNNIAFTSSRDGGKSFEPSRSVIETAPPYFSIHGLSRDGVENGFAQIAIDPKSNRLYLTWSDYRNGDIDVFAATSSDSGAHWSEPVRVNSDPAHDGTDQFYQWLAVDPLDGSANILFYDRRSDPGNQLTTVTLARSIDGGKTFTNYAWTTKPFTGDNSFLGDYLGLAAYSGKVFGIWPEQRGKKSKSHSEIIVGSADFGK